jgi:DNA-3-methyladenine glycosylase
VTLPRSFYHRPTLEVAADLIGKVLVHCRRGRRTSGVIVEVEAYIGESDPACHAAPGPTPRNRPLYGRPGHAYVYLNYGIHQLFNVVTEAEGSPAAVLIRALDPLDGIDLMRDRRGRRVAVHDLCRGPGNLTVAMGITLAQNAEDLVGQHLFIEDREDVCREARGEGRGNARGHPLRAAARVDQRRPLGWNTIEWSPRIGINVGVDRPWWAYVPGHPAVSGPRRPLLPSALPPTPPAPRSSRA